MGKKRTDHEASSRSARDPVRGSRWIGLALVALSLFHLASILTYDPAAYREAHARGDAFLPASGAFDAFTESGAAARWGPLAGFYHNAGGGLGLWLAALTLGTLGWVAVWIVALGIFGWGLNRLLVRPVRPALMRTLAAVPLAASIAAASAAVGGEVPGGNLGMMVWTGFRDGVGPVGAVLVVVVATVGFFVLEAEAFNGLAGRVLQGARERLPRWGRWSIRIALRGVRALVTAVRAIPWAVFFRAEEDELPGDSEARDRRPRPAAGAEQDVAASWKPRIVEAEDGGRALPSRAPAGAAPRPSPASAPAPIPLRDPEDRPRSDPRPAVAATAPEAVPIRRIPNPDAEPLDVEDAVREARRLASPGATSARSFKKRRGRMVLPTFDILDDVPEVGPPVPEAELLDNSRILTETLRDFGVAGRVGEVHPGPVITRYEYVPGPGVKVSQILNRQDDLALKLRASRIRILAPIPGKAAVGIEVPNRHPIPIFLRRLLETEAFSRASGPLPLAVGKDISGSPVITELSKMPHLLIAGTTGSGKSVCVNALITSLLLKRTPDELRLLMIDPKMLELPMYNGIPHLLTEVVTDPKLAARTLKWLLVEMERRYRVLAARGCRSLASYNAKMDAEGPRNEDEEKLPYIVVFIDELADLMITSGKEVEEPIGRLAQTARAVGIHLIVATQRPSVDVITGVLKANFPARIAFQVASKIDSRTILDQNGAESLLGKGDMLFLPPGQATPLRVHGAFVSEEETQHLAEAWRRQGDPETHPGLEEAMAEPEAAAGGLGDDPHFEDAARLVVAAGQASASLLQRRLKVGYARAARIVDMLEMAGIVAPQEGSKPREVLVDEVRLEHVLAGDEG